MSIINDIQKLITRSSLFVHEDKLHKIHDVRSKRKRGGHTVKIGQGGTLDPLADGVLGSCCSEVPNIFS